MEPERRTRRLGRRGTGIGRKTIAVGAADERPWRRAAEPPERSGLATALECVEQKIYNRAAAAEQTSQVPMHDLPVRMDTCSLSGNLTPSSRVTSREGFTRLRVRRQNESIVCGLRKAHWTPEALESKQLVVGSCVLAGPLVRLLTSSSQGQKE